MNLVSELAPLQLGWQEKVSWAEGLKDCIQWYSKSDEEGYWGNLSGALVAHPTGGKPTAAGSVYQNIEELMSPKAGKQGDGTGNVFLVYGRTGWIGGMLGKLLEAEGATWYFGKARLQDRAGVLDDIARSKPTHIFNAAGLTGRPNVDWCESHKHETIRGNVIGVLTLVDVARERGIHVTNFATGCIYSYDSEHKIGGAGFTEDDAPNFDGSFYSLTKGMVERMVREYNNVLQLRLRMPIDADLQNPRNFITKIANYERVVDIPNSMTVLEELIPMAVQGAKRGLTGVYNFTNPGAISHNEVKGAGVV